MFSAGDVDKIMEAVKLFDGVPLFFPLNSPQSRKIKIPTTSA